MFSSDAALRVVTAHGPARVTIDALADEMGGHVGSIYYRFPTKDHLLAQLWTRCARSGQAGMPRELGRDDREEAFEHAVLHYLGGPGKTSPRPRSWPPTGVNRSPPKWPIELAAELATANDDLVRAVQGVHPPLVRQRPRRAPAGDALRTARSASSAIRCYLLAGEPPPTSLDKVVLAAARAAVNEAARSRPRLDH